MKTTPTIYSPGEVIATARSNSVQLDSGTWVAARPMGFWGLCLRYRIKCAWLVFTGRADVL